MGFDAHQHVLDRDDTEVLSGVTLTAPLRTASDLVLTLSRFEPPDALEVRHLLALARASPADLGERLRRSRRRGSARGLHRLALVERTRLPGPVT